MAFKLVAFAALLAAASAGIIPAPVSYHAPAPVSYHAPAPVSYHAPAPVAYHHAPAPVAYHHAPAPVAYAAPVAKAVVKTIDADYDPNPEYSYSYDVHDTITGDAKSQQETRHGDVVEGSYSLIEADGTRRVVHYTADPHNGFNAVVEKEPAHHAAPVAVKAYAPAAYAAPAYAAPKAYAAPLYHH